MKDKLKEKAFKLNGIDLIEDSRLLNVSVVKLTDAEELLKEKNEEIEELKLKEQWIRVEDELPTEYGKYFICRKDGKIHWETWNGTGFAYNHNVITHWKEVKQPNEYLNK